MSCAPLAFPLSYRARHKQPMSKQMMSAPSGVIFKHFVYITCSDVSLGCSFSPSHCLSITLRAFFFFFFLLVKTICRFALDKNKAIHLLCPGTLSCKLRKTGWSRFTTIVYSSCGCLQWERHLSVRRVHSSQECILSSDRGGGFCLSSGTQ